MRRRQTHRSLTSSRIYQKNNRLYLFHAEAIQNPNSGKVSKWHSLCLLNEGEDKARQLANEILKHNRPKEAKGDLPEHLEKHRLRVLQKRKKDRPREPARALLFDTAEKEITRTFKKISDAFQDFDVIQVTPTDIAIFVDQWEGQRMAQTYLSRLSKFFAWTCRIGLRDRNPCSEVSVEKPAKRDRYINHKEFHSVRDALLAIDDSKEIPGGEMMQCYVDLSYLLYQRNTDVRLLKRNQIDIDNGVIHFTPTKTEKSSGVRVDIPITHSIQIVLDRVSKIGDVKSIYIIHKQNGQPYTASGVRSAWTRACKRAMVVDATLKDLRSKAATDAKKAGYRKDQIQIGLAHTNEGTTDGYIKMRDTPKSELQLSLPPKE